jgi:hypothetical protein
MKYRPIAILMLLMLLLATALFGEDTKAIEAHVCEVGKPVFDASSAAQRKEAPV